MRLASALADLLFPQMCAGCGQWGTSLCAQCRQAFGMRWRDVAMQAPFLRLVSPRDGQEYAAFPVYAAAAYQARVRSAIVVWKHAHSAALDQAIIALWQQALTHLPARPFAYAGPPPCIAGSAHAETEEPRAGKVCVVPAPSRWQRRHDGRLVVAKLARCAARRWQISYCDALRVRRSPRRIAQVLAAVRRATGIGARTYRVAGFAQRASKRELITARRPLTGWSVILVDDVLTTGATLSGMARAVERAGGEVIGAVTLAATVSAW